MLKGVQLALAYINNSEKCKKKKPPLPSTATKTNRDKRKAPGDRSNSLWELSARRRLLALSTNTAGLVPTSHQSGKLNKFK